MANVRTFNRYNYDNGRLIIRDVLFIFLAERDGYKCSQCGRTEEEVYDAGEALEKHRIIPGIKGGTYRKWNVKLVCSTCHYHLHPSDYKNGGNGSE